MTSATVYKINTSRVVFDKNGDCVLDLYDIIRVYCDVDHLPPNTFTSLEEAKEVRDMLLHGESEEARRRADFLERKYYENPKIVSAETLNA